MNGWVFAARWRTVFCIVALAWLAGACTTPYATVPDGRGASVMLLGHDPVAYFTQGAPVRGRPEHAATLKGRSYWFASAESKARFEADPARYEPQYGGFCANGAAYALKLGSDPTLWQIWQGRLFVFADPANQRVWQLDPLWAAEHADRVWPEIAERDWRWQSVYAMTTGRVSYYRSDEDQRKLWQARNPGVPWPGGESDTLAKDLFSKPPGWRAAEGVGRPAVGYPK